MYNDLLYHDEPARFPEEDIANFRCHAAKVAHTSLTLHLGLNRRAIRHQGTRKGHKNDLMPET